MKQQLLIVDDNEMMRSFLSHYFARRYDVRTAEDGREAWQFLDQGYFPDLMLLDLNMPGISGLELLKQMKCSVLFNDIPVMMISDVTKSVEKVNCLAAGAVDYVVKPFNPKELEIRMQYHIKVSHT
ncbi:MAG: response regulator transcription factor [Bacteroidota bacterium]